MSGLIQSVSAARTGERKLLRRILAGQLPAGPAAAPGEHSGGMQLNYRHGGPRNGPPSPRRSGAPRQSRGAPRYSDRLVASTRLAVERRFQRPEEKTTVGAAQAA